MKKLFKGKADQKNKMILLLSIAIVAAVGLAVVLSFSSTSLVSPFLTASVGGSVGTDVRITQAPSNISFDSMITIVGSGFTPETNRVHIGDKQVNSVKSFQNGTVLVFDIPTRKDIPTGTYQMFVRNSRGTSNSVTVHMLNPTPTPKPTITPTPTPTPQAPAITSIGSGTTGNNMTVTITGRGFTANNNQLFFVQQGVAVSSLRSTANGTVISFKVSDFIDCNRPGRLCLPGSATGTVQYPVYVKNANGQSNQMILAITR